MVTCAAPPPPPVPKQASPPLLVDDLCLQQVSAGYEYMLRVEPGPPNPRTGKPDNIPYTTVRGQFESDGRILVGIEQLTLGGQARLKLCAAMNHSRRDYRFGFGMEVNY